MSTVRGARTRRERRRAATERRDGPPEGRSGSKVVLGLLGGVVLIGVLAVGGFLLTGVGNNRLDCVRGEDTVNPKGPDGSPQLASRDFATIEEGEAFICHRIAYPRDTKQWRLSNVTARRTHSLGEIIEGTGNASVLLTYSDEKAFTDLKFNVSPKDFGTPSGGGPEQNVTIRGRPAIFQRGGADPNLAMARWNRDGLYILAIGFLGNEFQEQDFLAILETVR